MFGFKKKKKEKNKVYYSVQGQFLCAWLSTGSRLSNKTTVPQLRKQCDDLLGKGEYEFISVNTLKKGEAT